MIPGTENRYVGKYMIEVIIPLYIYIICQRSRFLHVLCVMCYITFLSHVGTFSTCPYACLSSIFLTSVVRVLEV